MISESLQKAIEVAAIDGKLKDLELTVLYRQAEEENVTKQEVDEYLKTYKINCPVCSKEMGYRSFMCHKCGYINNSRYRSLHRYAEIATPIIHFLGLVGIIIAIYELSTVHKISSNNIELAKKTDTLANRTNMVLSQMKTTHLEDFPNNMKGIIEIIKSAEKSLFIVVDVPAYGFFSNPDTCELYENAIINRMSSSPDFKFMMITYTDDLRQKKLLQQFQFKGSADSEKDFSSFLRSKPDFKKRFERFKNHHRITGINTFEKLFEAIDRGHRQFITTLKNQSREDVIHQVSCELTSYFWLIDEKQIAYSFVSLGKLVQECTFKSTDNDLLVTMKKTFENLKKED